MPTTLAVDLTDLDTFVQAVPHEQFDLLRREAPIYFHPETEQAGFWCITRYDDLHQISQTHQVFSSEWGITLHEGTEESLAQQRMMMLQMDPPRHTRLRLIVRMHQGGTDGTEQLRGARGYVPAVDPPGGPYAPDLGCGG